MNILILSWRAIGHPNAGGAEKVTFEHAKAWFKAGHKVTIFSSGFSNSKKEEIINGIKIIRSGDQVLGVRVKSIFWYLFLKDKKYDLVIDEIHGLPFFTPLFVRVQKLVFIHEVAKEVWKLNPWPKPLNLIPAFLGYIFEPLIFKIFYKNSKYLTVSKSTKNDLIDLGIPPNSISIIHNGLDIKKSNKKYIKEKKITIIFLGALTKDKGIEDAIYAFSILNDFKKDWQYWIVGKGSNEYILHLKKMIKKNRINKNIKFWGYVGENEKIKLLSKAHILINPSIREGWGLTVIEAASLGTPTVGYNVPGLRDSIQNNKTGFLSQKNPNDLAMKVIKLIDDKTIYKKFQSNCINWSNKFNWKISTKKSLKLIEKMVNLKTNVDKTILTMLRNNSQNKLT